MADIRTNTESMQTAAGQFAAQSVQLADLISQVGKDITALQEMWQGPAASQFASLMAQWHTDVNGIQHVLEEVGQRVQSAGIGYGDLDDQIRRGFQAY
jgi:WXG100 family type VII secretion target